MRTPGAQSAYANLKPPVRLYRRLSAAPVDEPDGKDAAGNGADHQPGKADEQGKIAAAALETADVGDFGDDSTQPEAGDGADDRPEDNAEQGCGNRGEG